MKPAQLDRMRALWEGSPEMTAAVIGGLFGVSKSAVIGRANRSGWAKRPARNQNTTGLSIQASAAIAAILKPTPRVPLRDRAPADSPAPRHLFDRMEALHRDMDAVLAETGARR